jgi:hypothetical protein
MGCTTSKDILEDIIEEYDEPPLEQLPIVILHHPPPVRIQTESHGEYIRSVYRNETIGKL